MCCLIPNIYHYEKGKPMEAVKNQQLSNVSGEEGMNRQYTEDF